MKKQSYPQEKDLHTNGG